MRNFEVTDEGSQNEGPDDPLLEGLKIFLLLYHFIQFVRHGSRHLQIWRNFRGVTHHGRKRRIHFLTSKIPFCCLCSYQFTYTERLLSTFPVIYGHNPR